MRLAALMIGIERVSPGDALARSLRVTGLRHVARRIAWIEARQINC